MTLRDLRPELGGRVSGGRRLLLISYHFPPNQSVGALRWQQLARYAADRGWGVDVVTLDPTALDRSDPDRLRALPDAVRVFGVVPPRLAIDKAEASVWRAVQHLRVRRAPSFDRPGESGGTATPARPSSTSRADVAFRPTQFRDHVRAFHAWRAIANDRAWAMRALAVARSLYRPGEHRVVVTCGPPHMCHEAGRRLARSVGVPHVMDLRDPWSLVERQHDDTASPVWYYMADHYERRAVENATLVVMNTDPARAAMIAKYPAARSRVMTVMNGYDDDSIPEVAPDGTFRVSYAGTIYIDRDPRLLFRAAAQVIAELRLRPDQFAIDLMGHVVSYEGRALSEIARDEGIEGFVHLTSSGPRHAALAFQARATMLVSLPQDSEMAIPSKIFEYMLFNAWILVMARRGSASADLLIGTGADVVDPTDLPGLSAVLRDRYQQFAAGVHPTRIVDGGRFSRRSQANTLLDALDHIAP